MQLIRSIKDIPVKKIPNLEIIDNILYSSISLPSVVHRTSLTLDLDGLKLRPDGTILARPVSRFHKLNNSKSWKKIKSHLNKHNIIQPVYGRHLIHSALLGGKVVFMEKEGITERSQAFTKLLKNRPRVIECCAFAENFGWTANFNYNDTESFNFLCFKSRVNGNILGRKATKKVTNGGGLSFHCRSDILLPANFKAFHKDQQFPLVLHLEGAPSCLILPLNKKGAANG